MNMFRFTLTVLALGLVTSGLAPDATAQAWPTKPVKVIAVFPAGGSVEIKRGKRGQRLVGLPRLRHGSASNCCGAPSLGDDLTKRPHCHR